MFRQSEQGWISGHGCPTDESWSFMEAAPILIWFSCLVSHSCRRAQWLGANSINCVFCTACGWLRYKMCLSSKYNRYPLETFDSKRSPQRLKCLFICTWICSSFWSWLFPDSSAAPLFTDTDWGWWHFCKMLQIIGHHSSKLLIKCCAWLQCHDDDLDDVNLKIQSAGKVPVKIYCSNFSTECILFMSWFSEQL